MYKIVQFYTVTHLNKALKYVHNSQWNVTNFKIIIARTRQDKTEQENTGQRQRQKQEQVITRQDMKNKRRKDQESVWLQQEQANKTRVR